MKGENCNYANHTLLAPQRESTVAFSSKFLLIHPKLLLVRVGFRFCHHVTLSSCDASPYASNPSTAQIQAHAEQQNRRKYIFVPHALAYHVLHWQREVVVQQQPASRVRHPGQANPKNVVQKCANSKTLSATGKFNHMYACIPIPRTCLFVRAFFYILVFLYKGVR